MTKNEITIKEYFETKIQALENATTVAAIGMEKRLEGMNEFRNQLKDQTSTFITRLEVVSSHERMNRDIKDLQDNRNVYIPRIEYESQHKLLTDDIRVLRESKATIEGKASQSSTNIATIIAIIGVLLALLSIVIKYNT